MSQTKVWAANAGTSTRIEADGSPKTGCGGSKHIYAGRAVVNGKTYQHTHWLRFAIDWADVGTIIKATLNVWTDDLGAIAGAPKAADVPTFWVRAATSTFTVGNNIDGTYDTSDWTAASNTSTGQIKAVAEKEANGLNRVDVTSLINGWAPKTVKQSTGSAGAGSLVYGLAIIGDTTLTHDWAGWSEDAPDAAKRPFIELIYEYGATTPNVPTSLTPSGAQGTLPPFEADFSDKRTTDTLRSSEVQIFSPGKAGTVATSDIVTSVGHGLANGGLVWLIALTGGTGLATYTPYYIRAKTTDTFKLATTNSDTTIVNVTVAGTLTWVRSIYDVSKTVTDTERLAGRSSHVAAGLILPRNVTHTWRVRQTDQEGMTSAWSPFASFSVTNIDPNVPTLKPASGSSVATLDGVQFSGGTFSDTDSTDRLFAYQVQMSAYASGNAHWDDAEFILWDTGKKYVTNKATSWSTPYTGSSLNAGTYYWRARQWDNEDGVSAWTYATLVVTASFEQTPGVTTNIQVRPHSPWRIVIKDMYQSDGVTRTVGRGPGRVVAVLENAKSVGASIVYNSPGEAHWTLPVDDPQISVLEPKQTHYSFQFYSGDGWREVYAGLVWDYDATETGVVFYGIDYLALYDYILDERYNPTNINLPSESGGSKYITTGKNSLSYIVGDQLARAKALPNSPVGFITVGAIATMAETTVVYSTYQPCLTFVTGLIDSHRGGVATPTLGKRSRIQVRLKTGGGYEVVVVEDPGIVRDNLRLKYGELVQGYRVIPFGQGWSSRVSSIGRPREGIQVLYETKTAPGIDEAVWGRFTQAQMVDGVTDSNDLKRRTQQSATKAGKLGKQVGLGIRSGVLQPLDGYDVTDVFPVYIKHGSVDTTKWGSGYWACMAVTWEADDNGKQAVTLTLQPREDSTPPSSDLLTLRKISPQREWQVGWKPPDPLKATSVYWLDQSTRKVYIRDVVTGTARLVSGTP